MFARQSGFVRNPIRTIALIVLVLGSATLNAQWTGTGPIYTPYNVGIQVTGTQALDVGGNCIIRGSAVFGGLHTPNSSVFEAWTNIGNFNTAFSVKNSDFVDQTTGTSIVMGLGSVTGNTFGLFQSYNTGGAQVGNLIFNYLGGNVGLGAFDVTHGAQPQYTLDVHGTGHVTGSMTVDGNIAAKYQDLAEWVPASAPMSAGTVVVLNDRANNEVTRSSRAYDTKVAGVVSDQPGITFGVVAENKAKVATTGRVRVKVDATRGAVKVGDLLVTSDKPGFAMKSRPVQVAGVKMHRPGTLIGKALEPLPSGEGEILVLLSLQ